MESGHAFRMRSAHDIFRKLHREKSRLEKAESDREGLADQVDAAVNFAITAWHMIDWVWQRREHEFRECLGVKCFREFQDEMRRQCRGLAVCDVIANAAKHGGTAHEREDRPEIETVLVADAVPGGPAGVELTAKLAERQWSLEIKVNGTREDLLALFNRVFLFWYKVIQKHFIAEKSS